MAILTSTGLSGAPTSSRKTDSQHCQVYIIAAAFWTKCPFVSLIPSMCDIVPGATGDQLQFTKCGLFFLTKREAVH